MGCQACDAAQEDRFDPTDQPQVFVRVGRADVEIVACPEHTEQAVDVITGRKTLAEVSA